MSKTQESFDAFYIKQDLNNPEQSGIYFFQITIAQIHSVKFNGLNKIIQKVNSRANRFLFFVIPSDSKMNHNKDQMIINNNNSEYKYNTKLQQYYIKLDIKKDLFNYS